MWKVTTAQMRLSRWRLVPAGVAVAIATAFVAATVLVAAIVDQTTRASVSERFAQADLVLSPFESQAGADYAEPRYYEQIRALPGVSASMAEPIAGALVGGTSADEASVSVSVAAVDRGFPEPASRTYDAGRQPAEPGEIALDAGTLARLHSAVGHRVSVRLDSGGEFDATVVGAFTQRGDSRPRMLTHPADLSRPGAGEAGEMHYVRIYLVADHPDQVAREVGSQFPDLVVRTADQQTEMALASALGSIQVLTGFVYGFVAVALFVAALVIANTFQVLIATRTRTLALERCLGATRAQVRRTVIYEALVLGAIASVVGLALGTGVTQLVLSLVSPRADMLLPRLITPSWDLFVAPLALGLLVTVGAALLPARLATRVAPLAALRPQQAPQASSRAGRLRLATGLGLGLLGAVGLAAAVWRALDARGTEEVGLLLLVAVVSAVLFVVGLLLLTVFWLPRLVGAVGRTGRAGGDLRLAAVNAVRNPRRTAATSVALIIAVGLVATVATGASVARTSLDRDLARTFPIDLTVTAEDVSGSAPLGLSDRAVISPELKRKIEELAGVEKAIDVTFATVDLDVRDSGSPPAKVPVAGVDPVQLASISSGRLVAELSAGRILIGPGWSLSKQSSATLTSDAGSVTAQTGDALSEAQMPMPDALVSQSMLARLADDTPRFALWLRLAPDANVSQLRDQIAALCAAYGVPAPGGGDEGQALGRQDVVYSVSGGFEQRARYTQVIDTLLLVVLGLLTIAVAIAFVGVANTLSLSIRERRNETAILRSLGLTRGRLRRQLAVEGMLIAGLGAFAGCAIGAVLGWCGVATLLATMGDPTLNLPWLTLVVILLVAVAAGAVASLLPGRSSARTPPTAALVAE